MEGKQKYLNKNGPFQIRFRELCYQSGKTQDALADLFGVSRPTLAGWLIGKSTPSINALIRIAQHFNVSADYLLGLSDIASPDVSVSAAAKYTGLSEKAVKRLHFGLDDRRCNGILLSKKKKKKELRLMSLLIESETYYRIIDNLKDVEKVAYIKRILMLLLTRYYKPAVPAVNPKFNFTNEEDRSAVINILAQIHKTKQMQPVTSSSTQLSTMNDSELLRAAHLTLDESERALELHQFYAAKSFNTFIDLLVKSSYKKAETQLKVKQ